MQKLLEDLDTTEYRPVPKGAGQKAVNIATANGWIESRKSRETLSLPDLHRLTALGANIKRRR